MSIAKQIFRNLLGLAHDAAESTSNVGREARQIARELHDKIAKVEAALVEVKADYALANNNVAALQAESQRWHDNARKALQQNQEDLAKSCIVKKQEADAKLAQAQAQVAALMPQVTALDNSWQNLQKQSHDLDVTSDTLHARSQIAKTQAMSSQILHDIAGLDTSSSLGRLENTVKHQEARAQVMAEHAAAATGQDLEAAVNKLNATSVQDELAALKASI